MEANINEAMQRTRRYWYEDGLGEIAGGVLLLLTGVLLFLEALSERGTFLRSFTAIVLPIVIIGGTLLAKRLVGAVKSRLTYPRTGYVSYGRPTPVRRLTTVVVGVVTSAAVVTLARWPEARSFIAIMEGLVFAASFAYVGHWLGLTRFYVLGLVSLVSGLLIYRVQLDFSEGLAAFFCVVGASAAVSGAVTLLAYLRNTRPAGEV